MILLTSFYHDADANRRGELLECLRRNAAVERLAEMHVFIEDAMATGSRILAPAVTGEAFLSKYKSRLPDCLLEEWQISGFGGFANGFIWLPIPRTWDSQWPGGRLRRPH